MNQKIKLDELKIQEYAQKRKIEQLRKVMFSQTEETTEGMDRLLEAERELEELEKRRDSLMPLNNSRSLVLSTKIENSKSSSNVVVRSRSKTKKEIEVEVYINMKYVPTAIYHLFDLEIDPKNDSLIECRIKVIGSDKQIKITSYIEGYSSKAINTIEVKANEEEEILYQLPTLFPHLIKNITELTKAMLHVKVEEVGGSFVKEDSHHISLLSRNSAIIDYYNLKENKVEDISNFLGVFVTPNQPEIIQFLRTVTDFHPMKQLGGYQGNQKGDIEFKSGKASVIQQLNAIFNALKKVDLTYTNSVIDSNSFPQNFNNNNNFYGQRVRLPKESLKERQANCIDGTFLYASLLEACSLNSAIVLMKGHSFLAWESWENNREWRFLETIMTSSHPFEEACIKGEYLARTHKIKIIPINDLRARGIMPME